MNRGKKYVEAAKAVDRATLYDTDEAVALVKKAELVVGEVGAAAVGVRDGDLLDLTVYSWLMDSVYDPTDLIVKRPAKRCDFFLFLEGGGDSCHALHVHRNINFHLILLRNRTLFPINMKIL